MTPQERLAKLEELKKLRSQYRILTYAPYPKQQAFHHLRTRERALFGANRSGKTFSAGMEVAMHLTGFYPDWWKGVRFQNAVRWGIGSETGDLLKKGPQRILYGPMEAIGTGTIPKDLLVVPPKMSRGIPDGIDTLQVRHCTDGKPDGTLSAAVFMSYADGRAKWASDEWDGAWLDEEPDLEIYTEGLTRTNTSMGPVLLTFTPLRGVSDVVQRFLEHKSGTSMVSMTLDDALHFTPEQRVAIADSYPDHEKEARTRGLPMLGEGKIFKHPENLVRVEAFDIPKHWAVIGGLDFGVDHPFAAVKLAWDRDNDQVFVTHAFRERGLTPMAHASALRHWGNIRWAWPHDGNQRRVGLDGRSFKQVAQFYRDEGMDLVSEHAQYADERGNGEEAAILDLQQRLERGGFHVFSHLDAWFEEYRYYHRKEGKPVAVREDLLKATMYALMMLRYAEISEPLPKSDRYSTVARRIRSWMAA